MEHSQAYSVLYRLRQANYEVRLSQAGNVQVRPSDILPRELHEEVVQHKHDIAEILRKDPFVDGLHVGRHPYLCITCGLTTRVLDMHHECILCTDRRAKGLPPPKRMTPESQEPRICPRCGRARSYFYKNGLCTTCGSDAPRIKVPPPDPVVEEDDRDDDRDHDGEGEPF